MYHLDYFHVRENLYVIIIKLMKADPENMSVKCIPLEPHFYIAKLGCVGVYLFFLLLLQNIDCGYSEQPRRDGSNETHNLEPHRRGGSNLYPQTLF